MSLEVPTPAESVGAVAGAQNWRQRIPNFMRCVVVSQRVLRPGQRSLRAANAVRANGRVNRLLKINPLKPIDAKWFDLKASRATLV